MSSEKGASRAGAGGIALTLSRRLGMVIVLALAFFMSATITIYTLFRSGDTRVPNVIGRSESEAQQIAAKAGLIVKVQRRSDDKIPANTVIETRPGPNSSVKKDSPLTIVVSSGPAQNRSELRLSGLSFLLIPVSHSSPEVVAGLSVLVSSPKVSQFWPVTAGNDETRGPHQTRS